MTHDRVSRLRWTGSIALVAVLALVLGACGGDDDGGGDGGDGSGGDASGDETVEIAHFVAHQANPYEQAHIAGVEETAADMGGEVTLFDGANDPQSQQTQCQDAIASQRYDAFVLKAVAGPTMMSCVREALDAGIFVVATDTPIGEDMNTTEPQVEGLEASVLVLPATDAQASVELAADACADIDPCRVVYMMGPPEFTFVAERQAAFTEAIESDHPNIEIVDEGVHGFDPDTGFSVARQLMQRHDDEIDVIVSDADPGSLGIQRALDELGADDVVHIAGGGSEEGAQFVRDGVWFGTSALFPYSMGERATELAIAGVRGEDLGEAQVDVIRDLSTGGPAITKQNVDDFEPEWTLGS